MTTPEEIDLLIKAPTESPRLEFKEAKNQFDTTRLFKYCVALANEGGGYLILGVTDKAPRRVIGTEAFPNPLDIADKIFQRVGFYVTVEEIAHPEGRLVVFRCPSRPRGTVYSLDGSYWMRSGESLVPMPEDRLRAIFAEGAPDWLEDYCPETLSSHKLLNLLDLRGFFELLQLPFPQREEAILDRLVHERLIVKVEQGYKITRLAALLLAYRLSDFPDLERKAPRVIVYEGINKLRTLHDQSFTRGIAVGFPDFNKEVLGRIPNEEVIENSLRTTIRWVPSECLRELLANAIIHQDFQIRGTSVMVEIFANRIEISNPGTPIITTERFIDGYQSRNERLADLMRRMRICEEKGSGIDRVINEVEHSLLPPPEFTAAHHRTSVILFSPKAFEEMDRADKLRACYQHCCLRYVSREYMTNQSLRERFKLPEQKSSTVSQLINLAISEGLIRPDQEVGSSRKYARYVPSWA